MTRLNLVNPFLREERVGDIEVPDEADGRRDPEDEQGVRFRALCFVERRVWWRRFAPTERWLPRMGFSSMALDDKLGSMFVSVALAEVPKSGFGDIITTPLLHRFLAR